MIGWNDFIKSKIKNQKSKIQIQKSKNESQDDNVDELSIAQNCWVYPTRSSFKMKCPFDAISLGRFIINKRGITDITCQDPFLTAMAGVSLKKRFNIHLEIQLHTDIGSPNYVKSFSNKIRKALASSYLPKADSLRVVSNRIESYLVDSLGIDRSKIVVKPIKVDTDWIRSTSIIESADLHKKYPQFDKIILMASRLEKEKNIGLAIDAFKEVLRRLPETGLVIVGSGSQARYLRTCALKLAPKNVFFESWADKNTLASYYKTADLFLNTSLFEGYGMTLIEAQAAGCQIVSTDVGIAKEAGAIIARFDGNDIAEKIIDSLDRSNK